MEQVINDRINMYQSKQSWIIFSCLLRIIDLLQMGEVDTRG